MAETYAQSKEVLQAIQALEALEKSGDIRPGEQKALDEWRKKEAGARGEVRAGDAAYRGFRKELTLGLYDEGAAAVSSMFGGDYANTRDDIRAKDAAAEFLNPEEFSKGGTAGGIAVMAMPSLGVMKITSQMGPVAKALYSGAAGGLLGGLSGFGHGEGGLESRLKSAAVPAGIGAGLGLLAPALGYASGKIVRAAQDKFRAAPGFGAKATQAVAGAINRSQAAGQDIAAYLDSLGPEGMIADIPGNPRRVAQGLAAMPGEGGEILGTAIETRAAQAPARIKATADAAISGPDAAFAERARLAAERSHKLGPEYEAALNTPDPIDASDIGSAIGELSADAVGGVAASLSKIEAALGKTVKVVDGKKVTTFEPISAVKLHNIRSELSDDIEEARRAGRGKFVAQMSPVLEQIDARLDQLPGYADARTGYANNKAMERALEEGRAVFRGGEASAMSPNELRAVVQKMTPPQLDAYRKGAREYIAALMGTSKNDAAAAWGAFAKEWNEEKLRIILGKPEADKLINRLKAENIFSVTRGDVLKGSQTQMRAESAAAIGDFRTPETGQRPGPIKRVTNALNAAGNSAIDTIMYGGRGQANLELGKLLSMQGLDRDKMLPFLLQEAARKNVDSKTQRAVSGLLDLALRSSAPAVIPLMPGNTN